MSFQMNETWFIFVLPDFQVSESLAKQRRLRHCGRPGRILWWLWVGFSSIRVQTHWIGYPWNASDVIHVKIVENHRMSTHQRTSGMSCRRASCASISSTLFFFYRYILKKSIIIFASLCCPSSHMNGSADWPLPWVCQESFWEHRQIEFDYLISLFVPVIMNAGLTNDF